MAYYLLQYADGSTSLTHTIRGYMMEAINSGVAEIVAEEATLTDLLLEMVRLSIGG